jgi:iron complex outermembrane recepter protein
VVSVENIFGTTGDRDGQRAGTAVQHPWTTMDASVGVGKDEWNAKLFVTNLTDETKSVYTTASRFLLTEVPMRPRTIGLCLGYSFGGN